MYLCTDVGDPFFDDASQLPEIKAWFARHVALKLRAKGADAALRVLKIVNPQKVPGPAFNWMTGVAFKEGAKYIYRVNDDTELQTRSTRRTAQACTRCSGLAWSHPCLPRLALAPSPRMVWQPVDRAIHSQASGLQSSQCRGGGPDMPPRQLGHHDPR